MPEESFQEKTEPASDKRRQDAKRKGKVPRSVEVTSAMVMLCGLMVLSLSGQAIVERIITFSRTWFARSGVFVVTSESAQGLVAEVFATLGLAMGPLLIGVMIVGLASNVTQIGFVYSPELLRPNWDKVSPLQGVRRIMFSRRSAMEVGKSLLKILAVGWVAYTALVEVIVDAPLVMESDAQGILQFIGTTASALAWRSGIAFLVLALLDFWYQRVEYERDLRMTKDEVKEETKTMEGDPLIKSRIRTIQRRIAYRRMMQEVPKADVVVTNPTHLAVAIQYDSAEMTAPKVVAKGADFVAQKIREIALENKIPIVEDKPLAQTLYRTVDIGEEIPEKLFQAVAQLLAYIYRLKQTPTAINVN